jgi:putative glutamine amidotransferase
MGRPARPLIGIPTQTLHAIEGIPERLPASWVMNQRYYRAAAAAGAVPLMIPLLEDTATLRELYDRLDGLLLAGGVDMEPATYGEEKTPLTGATDPARDRVELQLARWALEEGKPLFGICRGLQVLNVALGGTLVQDIAAEWPGAVRHDYLPTQGFARDHLAHPVTVTPGSRLHAVLGSESVEVNSMHHQAVAQLGAGLRVTAVAPDGLIEAVETVGDGFVLAVQWHPESMSGAHAARLLAPFLAAASGVAMRTINRDSLRGLESGA